MGIVIFSRSPLLTTLLAPLHALAAVFLPAQSASSSPVFSAASASRPSTPGQTPPAIKNIAVNVRPPTTSGKKYRQAAAKTAAPCRLKIVRASEAGISPSCAGRMVISGRMADVCAELDRMAQKEAAVQTV